MVYIAFLYFLLLLIYYFSKSRRWSMDVAAVSVILLVLSAAIGIDILDLYGEYGCNDNHISLVGVILFCLEWTIVLQSIHIVSRKEITGFIAVPKKRLYNAMFWVIVVCAFVAVVVKIPNIIASLQSDALDVRSQHYEDMSFESASKERNIFMYLPGIFTSTPFPSLALVWWFYGISFLNQSFLKNSVLIFVSLAQVFLAILMAGRAAMIYWCIDFYLLACLFWPYMHLKQRSRIVTVAISVGVLVVGMMTMVTVARFDRRSSTPLLSVVGYAGQHLNNFCSVIEYGENAPTQIGRVFPLTCKLQGNQFRLAKHYANIEDILPIIVHNFDTFGAEVFLDFGSIGFVILLLMLMLINRKLRRMEQITFPNLIILSIVVAFFGRGLFAWPFVGHYTTLGLMMSMCIYVVLKYDFKFKS